jgi:uncharacterized protein (TIGR02246 family)
MTTLRQSEYVAEALDGWKRGVDAGRPADIASFFTEDALFQGSHPGYSIGRKAVEEYYSESHAVGLKVDYEVKEVRTLADGVLVGFLDPTFTRPDGELLRYHLTVVVLHEDDGRWRISHYHVSKIA